MEGCVSWESQGVLLLLEFSFTEAASTELASYRSLLLSVGAVERRVPLFSPTDEPLLCGIQTVSIGLRKPIPIELTSLFILSLGHSTVF